MKIKTSGPAAVGGGRAIVHFIIPIRAEATAKDWSCEIARLRVTLGSIRQQTRPDWIVTVVSSEALPVDLFDERIHNLVVNLSLPETWNEQIGDIKKKLREGLKVIDSASASFVMRIDGDDLIRDDIVEFAESLNGCIGGFYFQFGYVFDEVLKKIIFCPNIHVYCGSVVAYRIPAEVDLMRDEERREELLDLVSNHQKPKSRAASRGILLKRFPGIGCIQRIDYETNMGSTSPLTKKGWKGFMFRLWSVDLSESVERKLKHRYFLE